MTVAHVMISGVPLIEWPAYATELVAPRATLRHRTGKSRRDHVAEAVAAGDWTEVEVLLVTWRASAQDVAAAVTTTGVDLMRVYAALMDQVRYPGRSINEPVEALRDIEARIVRVLTAADRILHRAVS